ncbi:glutamate/tyrosine decarboxylase-like PLP-dependent enzyme [Gillisia mitskevichiae]|uniref:Glutamate/tyrosine decarboxylase-like PLP-dependent enzyme n=1 Tax=Gillisia mitskevichiae TaxID=270921 RepID=A0A495PY32_9FLAO|nr:aspartate aminotransferase family protein [Gillisia mitskevichiae]RKS55129.1 glutamate/tyrosine decarboxylase-like PLP-dependent enzyme [Gillisia mitskevichiae]
MHTKRETPIELSKEEFKKVGYQLIDNISEFLETIDKRPVTKGETPKHLQELLGTARLPENGTSAEELMASTTQLLLDHSLFNGHPKFLGYITSSAAPVGILADLLASSLNQNVGAQILSPIATEIEKQTVKWLAEFIGVSSEYSGILVSGGNMANFTGFLAGRTAKAPKNIKEEGMFGSDKLKIYCSKTTHTWVEKAAILFGLGSKSVRWIATTEKNKMDNKILEKTIEEDLIAGYKPIMIIGTAGDVSTGVVDHLDGIAELCKKHDLWFHVDGAYGVPAAVIPDLKPIFNGLQEADSIALDPHKWLYSPLEAGCTLVKNPQHLIDTFSSHPEYYNFGKDEVGSATNFYEYGLQNSRGFRALKVWLVLQQIGRSGYEKMIQQDIHLSELFYELANKNRELEAVTQNLSITTLRYIPLELDIPIEPLYLNTLNEALLDELQKGGEVFLSNAIVHDKYCLRACIVNFRTSEKDIEEIITIITREGKKMHHKLKNI